MAEVLEAHVTKVSKDEGTGWFTIETDGEPKKLTTKNERPAKDAAALRRDGALAVLTYTPKDRHDGDRVYHNFYLDKAEAAKNGSGDDGIEVVRAEGTSRKTDPRDAWRMCLNKGGELAVRTLPLMPTEERDFDTQKRIATAWARFFYFTPTPSPDEVAFAAEPSGPGAYDEPGASYEDPEDIPFLCLAAPAQPSARFAIAVTA